MVTTSQLAVLCGWGWKAVNGGDVPVLVFVLLVDAAHQRGGGRQDLINKDEDGLLGGQLDALADNVHELANREVGRHEVFLLVDRRDVRLFDLLADNGDPIRVFLTLERRDGWLARTDMGDGRGGRGRTHDTFGFSLALLEGVLVLELGSHGDG